MADSGKIPKFWSERQRVETPTEATNRIAQEKLFLDLFLEQNGGNITCCFKSDRKATPQTSIDASNIGTITVFIAKEGKDIETNFVLNKDEVTISKDGNFCALVQSECYIPITDIPKYFDKKKDNKTDDQSIVSIQSSIQHALITHGATKLEQSFSKSKLLVSRAHVDSDKLDREKKEKTRKSDLIHGTTTQEGLDIAFHRGGKQPSATASTASQPEIEQSTTADTHVKPTPKHHSSTTADTHVKPTPKHHSSATVDTTIKPGTEQSTTGSHVNPEPEQSTTASTTVKPGTEYSSTTASTTVKPGTEYSSTTASTLASTTPSLSLNLTDAPLTDKLTPESTPTGPIILQGKETSV